MKGAFAAWLLPGRIKCIAHEALLDSFSQLEGAAARDPKIGLILQQVANRHHTVVGVAHECYCTNPVHIAVHEDQKWNLVLLTRTYECYQQQYIYVYACINTHINVRTLICMHVDMHAIRIRINSNTYVYTPARTHAHAHTLTRTRVALHPCCLNPVRNKDLSCRVT